MKTFKYLIFPILFCCTINVKGQNKLDLSDSITYNIAFYSELYNMYKLSVFMEKEDSILLTLAYYPWKDVFDTHKIHRVSLYNDGIGILKGLIKYTNDSIQREIYINELMNLYDTWYKYAVIYSKTI